jgi:hypothetical protein
MIILEIKLGSLKILKLQWRIEEDEEELLNS